MSNSFKANSRFSSLIEETSKKEEIPKKVEILKIEEKPIKEDNKTNNFKNDNGYSRGRRNFNDKFIDYKEMYEKEEKIRKEEEKINKEKKKMEALSSDNFPELIKNNNKILKDMDIDNTQNFIEKLKTEKVYNKKEENKIQLGWSELKKDNITGFTNIKHYEKKKENINFNSDNHLVYDMIDTLVYLHDKRSNEYIDNWGYDEWENMFIFKNYDYKYFDKLDEIYEKNNPESESESEYDYYDNEDYNYEYEY